MDKLSLEIKGEIERRFPHSGEQYPWNLLAIKSGFISENNNIAKVEYENYHKFCQSNKVKDDRRVIFYQQDHFGFFILYQHCGDIKLPTINDPKFDVVRVYEFDGAILYKIKKRIPLAKELNTLQLKFDDQKIEVNINISWDVKWYIEEKTPKFIRGWAVNIDYPIKPIPISIIQNQKIAKIVEPTDDRADVAEIFGLDVTGLYGFRELVPQANSAVYNQKIVFYNTELTLMEDPEVFYNREIAAAFNGKVISHIKSLKGLSLLEKNYVNKIASSIQLSTYENYLKTLGNKIQYQLPRVKNAIGLSILIPVYSGFDEVQACIESVLASRTNFDLEIVVGYDFGPDPNIEKYLRNIKDSRVNIIFNEKNLGFVKNVNQLVLKRKYLDFLVLNADTIVPDDIFDGMLSQLNANRNYGSITVLSNNATILSLIESPDYDGDNFKHINSILKEKFNGITDIPVSHGFCMLVNGDTYNKMGLFDESKWGKGYGEEVDWSLRAVQELGVGHACYTGAIVYHKGSVSFGDQQRDRAIKKSGALIEALYPGFNGSIQSYILNGDLNKKKIEIDKVLFKSSSASLFLAHNFGGGIKTYIEEESKKAIKRNVIPIVGYLKKFENGSHWVFNSPKFQDRYFDVNDFSGIVGWLKTFELVSVSLEHLGEASPREITQLLDLCNISRYSVMLHDYGLICPRINLIDYQGKYCRVQSSDVCEFCISKAGPTESAIEMYSKIESTSQLREGSYNLLKNAFKISAPSMSARLGYKNLFRDLNIKVLPHHREIKFHQRIPNSRHSKTVAILGAISYAKGLALYKELADFMEKFAPEFRFVFIGYTENNKIFQNNKNVVITGKYSKENLKSLIEKYDPVISLHLNIWPETFSYTLSEALRNGLYPFYTELGAVADRLAPMGIGRKYKIDENILNMAKDIVGFYRDLVELEG